MKKTSIIFLLLIILGGAYITKSNCNFLCRSTASMSGAALFSHEGMQEIEQVRTAFHKQNKEAMVALSVLFMQYNDNNDVVRSIQTYFNTRRIVGCLDDTLGVQCMEEFINREKSGAFRVEDVSIVEVLIRMGCFYAVRDLASHGYDFIKSNSKQKEIPLITSIIIGGDFHQITEISIKERNQFVQELLKNRKELPDGVLKGLQYQCRMQDNGELALSLLGQFDFPEEQLQCLFRESLDISDNTLCEKTIEKYYQREYDIEKLRASLRVWLKHNDIDKSKRDFLVRENLM